MVKKQNFPTSKSLEKPVGLGLFRVQKIVPRKKSYTSAGGSEKVVFDNRDFGVLMLCGLCRYLPSGISEKFNSPYFTSRQLSTLRNLKCIKMQSNKLSYSMTKQGRMILENLGYVFPTDSKVDIGKNSYFRKLHSAYFNVTMFLAGINVFYENTKALEKTKTGYVSSLLLRGSNSGRALAGTRFLGILKMGSTAYIPYHIENAEEWILPGFERYTFTSQAMSVKSVKDIKLILSGESLEVLWETINPDVKSKPEKNGLKRFDIALEELGYDFLLVPESDFGVRQLSVIKIAGYGKRLAKALGCDVENKQEYKVCDGVCDNIPYIIAVDFNVNRIVRVLKEIERINPSVSPNICCFDFQKEVMILLLDKLGVDRANILSLDEDNVRKAFPEVKIDYKEFEVVIGKEGVPVDAYQRQDRKDNIKSPKA